MVHVYTRITMGSCLYGGFWALVDCGPTKLVQPPSKQKKPFKYDEG